MPVSFGRAPLPGLHFKERAGGAGGLRRIRGVIGGKGLSEGGANQRRSDKGKTEMGFHQALQLLGKKASAEKQRTDRFSSKNLLSDAVLRPLVCRPAIRPRPRAAAGA